MVSEGVVKRPNGLAFSPDEKKLYVIESQPLERAFYVFDVDGAKLNGKMLIKCTKEETPDGFRVDIDGNLWCGWGIGSAELDGVRIINAAGASLSATSSCQNAARMSPSADPRQPAVHDGDAIRLLQPLREHAGCAGWVIFDGAFAPRTVLCCAREPVDSPLHLGERHHDHQQARHAGRRGRCRGGHEFQPAALAQWQPSQRYPDPVRQDHRSELRASTAWRWPRSSGIATGVRWSEGPVWFGDGRYLLWSDIPNNRIMKWDEETGAVSVFRKPSNNSNGNTRDRQGRLLTCEHDTRRVTRTEYDGTITVIADRFDGKPLNSPERHRLQVRRLDLVHRSAVRHPRLLRRPRRQAGAADQRLSRGSADRQARRRRRRRQPPNGLALLARRIEAVRRRGGRDAARDPAFDVVDDGTQLANRRTLITAEPDGTPDGLRVDVDGNLWCGWGMGEEGLDGVSIFNPQGKLIGRIDLPERCANLCFGGRYRNRLFMVASTSVYSLYVNTQGVKGG